MARHFMARTYANLIAYGLKTLADVPNRPAILPLDVACVCVENWVLTIDKIDEPLKSQVAADLGIDLTPEEPTPAEPDPQEPPNEDAPPEEEPSTGA